MIDYIVNILIDSLSVIYDTHWSTNINLSFKYKNESL